MKMDYETDEMYRAREEARLRDEKMAALRSLETGLHEAFPNHKDLISRKIKQELSDLI